MGTLAVDASWVVTAGAGPQLVVAPEVGTAHISEHFSGWWGQVSCVAAAPQMEVSILHGCYSSDHGGMVMGLLLLG